MFCNLDESIDHLFFSCPVTRYVWNVVKCAFNLQDIPDSFDALVIWFSKFPVSVCGILASGVAAILWPLWKSRNTAVFDGVLPIDPTAIVFLVA